MRGLHSHTHTHTKTHRQTHRDTHTVVLKQLLLELGQGQSVLRGTAAIVIKTHLVQLGREEDDTLTKSQTTFHSGTFSPFS